MLHICSQFWIVRLFADSAASSVIFAIISFKVMLCFCLLYLLSIPLLASQRWWKRGSTTGVSDVSVITSKLTSRSSCTLRTRSLGGSISVYGSTPLCLQKVAQSVTLVFLIIFFFRIMGIVVIRAQWSLPSASSVFSHSSCAIPLAIVRPGHESH